MKQMTLATAKGFEVHGRATRKAEFLARMEALVPWAQVCAVIEPHYPKKGSFCIFAYYIAPAIVRIGKKCELARPGASRNHGFICKWPWTQTLNWSRLEISLERGRRVMNSNKSKGMARA